MDEVTLIQLVNEALPANWGAIIAAAVPALASICSIYLPSGSKTMKVIDALALNLGKAKNDPGAQ